MDLANTLPKILATDCATDSLVDPAPKAITESSDGSTSLPEQSAAPASALEFTFAVPLVKLELYGPDAVSSATLKQHSIARFSINRTNVAYKTGGDGSMDVKVTVSSINMTNTRAGTSYYRTLIPEGERSGNVL